MITRARLLRLGALCSLALAGGMAQAADVDPAVKEKLEAAIVKHGCKVTDSNNEAILAEAGLEPVAAKTVVEALLADGTAGVEGKNLVLKTEGCN